MKRRTILVNAKAANAYLKGRISLKRLISTPLQKEFVL